MWHASFPNLLSISFVTWSALQWLHSLFGSCLSPLCNPLPPPSFFNTPSFPQYHPSSAYLYFLIFPSLLPSIFPSLTCFRRPAVRISLKFSIQVGGWVINKRSKSTLLSCRSGVSCVTCEKSGGLSFCCRRVENRLVQGLHLWRFEHACKSEPT
jgi:hypothetical protein